MICWNENAYIERLNMAVGVDFRTFSGSKF